MGAERSCRVGDCGYGSGHLMIEVVVEILILGGTGTVTM